MKVIKPSDSINIIIKNPNMYLGVDYPTESNLAEGLFFDAFSLGSKHIEIRRLDEWVIISSDVNWSLINDQNLTDYQDIFDRLIYFSRVGSLALRTEVFLKAFCTNVFIMDKDNLIIIKGSHPNIDVSKLNHDELVYSVGFMLKKG